MATVLSLIGAAVLFAFAAEGVRSALIDDTRSPYRYFVVVDQVYPRIAPDTNAGEAVGLLFAGDAVDVVCVRVGSWAKLNDGGWVPVRAGRGEVDAEPAPHC